MTASSTTVEQPSGQTGEEVKRADLEETGADSSFEVVGEAARVLRGAQQLADAINTLCCIEDETGEELNPHIDAMQDIHRKLAELAGRLAACCEMPALPAYIARAPEAGGLKLGTEASKVALLARRLAGVIQEFSNLETESESQSTIAECYDPMIKNLEKAYGALWDLAGKELLIEDFSKELGSLTPQDFDPAEAEQAGQAAGDAGEAAGSIGR